MLKNPPKKSASCTNSSPVLDAVDMSSVDAVVMSSLDAVDMSSVDAVVMSSLDAVARIRRDHRLSSDSS